MRSRGSNLGDTSLSFKVCILDHDVVRDDGRVLNQVARRAESVQTSDRVEYRLAWCVVLTCGMRGVRMNGAEQPLPRQYLNGTVVLFQQGCCEVTGFKHWR